MIDAPKDVVYHYNFADTVNVKQVNTASYHECGEVSFFEVSSGNIVLEKISDVKFMYFNANANGEFKDATTNVEITLDVSQAENIPEFSRSDVSIPTDGKKVCEIKTTSSEEAVWLWSYGIKEQMKMTADLGATKVTKDDGGIGTRTDETAVLAEQIANNVSRGPHGKPLNTNGEEVTVKADGTIDGVSSLEDLKPAAGGFVKAKDKIKEEAIVFGGGNGSVTAPFKIRCREDFEFIYSHYDSYYYYEVDVNSGLWDVNPGEVSSKNKISGAKGNSADGKAHMDASNWALKLTDSGNYTTRNNLYGSLAGNGLVIDNLDTWLFATVGNSLTDNTPIVISDLVLNMDWKLDGATGVAAVCRQLGTKNITFDNVDITGTLFGNSNTGSYYGYGTCNYDNTGGCSYTAKFIDCTSSASLYDISGNNIGGMLAHPYQGTGHTATLDFVNSFYTGTTYTTGTNNSTKVSACGGGTCSGLVNEKLPQEQRKNITLATITKDATTNATSVVIPTNSDYAIVNIFGQYTKYDNSGKAIENQGGITAAFDARKVEGLSSKGGQSLELYGAFSSIHETTGNDRLSASVANSVLTLNMYGNQDGRIYVKVTFFNAKGELISTGNLQICSKDKADYNKDAWVIK